MFLYLGQNVVVPQKTVIGIFDMDNTTGSRATREFLKEAEKAGRVISVTGELPNSFVVCEEHGDTSVYLSQLSSNTLLKRISAPPFDS